MTDLDFAIFRDEYLPSLYGAQLYKNWVRDNCGKRYGGTPDKPAANTDVARWYGFRDMVLAGKQPVPPSMNTAYGDVLVDAARLAIQEPAEEPPPPPPSDWWASVQTTMPLVGTQIVAVTSEPALRAAITALKPGQTIIAVSPFNVGSTLKITGLKLAAPALINLTGVTVKGGDLGAVYLDTVDNVWLYGGDLTATRRGIQCESVVGVRWHEFKVHDCGDHGVFVNSIDRDTVNLDMQGEIENCALRWREPKIESHQPPEQEPGTGVHGSYIGARLTDLQWVRDSRFVLDVHDQHAGAAIQVGGTIYDSFFALRAARITFNAQKQVAGSGLQVWGEARDLELQVEATDLAGRAVDTNGLYGGASGIRVTHGRATRCCTNPKLSGQSPFQPHAGVTFTDCKVL